MPFPWTSLTAAAAVELAEDGTWSGVIAPLGEWSADGRMLAPPPDGEVPTRPLPLPVAVQDVLAPGHDGATVGLMTLDEVWREGDLLMGRGRVDLEDPAGVRLANKIRKKFLRFVSADVDETVQRFVCLADDGQVQEGCDPAEWEGDVGAVYDEWRIMGATMVGHPAFPNAQIAMTAATDGAPTHAGLALKAADTGRLLLIQRALDDEDPASGTWEFPGGSIEPDEDPLTAAHREFAEETGAPVPDGAEVVGEWTSDNGVYRGYLALVSAEDDVQLNLDPDDRAVLNPDDPDGDRIEVVAWWDVEALPEMPALREEARATPWDLLATAGADDTSPAAEDAVTAAVRIDGWEPPTAWFRDPQLDGPQPITVDADGRVFGHLAAWGVPHRSYPGRDVMAPHSPSSYALFNSRPVSTSEGLVDVGLITMDTGHAALGLDRRAAAAHYDNSGTQAAVVRAGEDAHGIWVAGAVLPWLSDEQRLRLSLSRFSGDWRQEGSGLELVAALAVNTEGFPVPQRRTGRDAEDYALVAAGALPAPEARPVDFARLVDAVTAEQARRAQRQARAATAAAALRKARVALAARRVRVHARTLPSSTDQQGRG